MPNYGEDLVANPSEEPEIHSLINNVHNSLSYLEDEVNMICSRVSCITSPAMPQPAEPSNVKHQGTESQIGNELASILTRVRKAADAIKDTRLRLCV